LDVGIYVRKCQSSIVCVHAVDLQHGLDKQHCLLYPVDPGLCIDVELTEALLYGYSWRQCIQRRPSPHAAALINYFVVHFYSVYLFYTLKSRFSCFMRVLLHNKTTFRRQGFECVCFACRVDETEQF